MKRKWLGVLAAAGLGSVAMVPGPTGAAASKTENYVVNVPEYPMTTLDPIEFNAQILLDMGTIFEGLIGYNKNLQLVPKIAERWTISKNGLVYTFYLRKNARWSNGKPVTAEDFYYAWMRFVSPKDAQAPLWYSAMQFVKNAYNYHAGSAPASAVGLSVVNPYELRVTLAKPQPDFIGYLPLATGVPVYPPDVSAHPSTWWMPKYFVGDGPYVVKSFVPNGQVSLVRNSDYVGHSGEFNVGNVNQINVIPIPSTPLEDFLANKFGFISLTSPSDYQYAKEHLRNDLHKVPYYQLYTLLEDHAIAKSPLDNPLVRKAIAEAINRRVITSDVLNGMDSPANVFGPPGWPTVKYQHGLPENVAAARKLLAQAGYPGGRGLPTFRIYTLTAPDPSVSVGEAIAQQLKTTLGMHVKIDPTNSTVYEDMIFGTSTTMYSTSTKPGYVIAQTGIDWWRSDEMGFQSDLPIFADYPPAIRKHLAEATLATYNPYAVSLYGNPANPSAGTTPNAFVKLDQSFKTDAAYLTKYAAAQTNPAYKRSLEPSPSYQATWSGFVDAWKHAKTKATKHAAWVNAWQYIGNGLTGLDEAVWLDQHRPAQMTKWLILYTDENSASLSGAAKYGGELSQDIINSGWDIPLYIGDNVFLQKPWLSNVVVNKFTWYNFSQLQYLVARPH